MYLYVMDQGAFREKEVEFKVKAMGYTQLKLPPFA